MRRGALIFLAGLSLGLCLAMVGAWAWSNGHDLWFQVSIGHFTHALKIRGGLVSFYRVFPGGGYRSPPIAIAETWIYYPLALLAFSSYLLCV